MNPMKKLWNLELPKFEMPPRTKIEDKERLNFFEKYKYHKTLKEAKKLAPKLRKEFLNKLREKDEIITKLLELTEVLNIEEEITKKNKEGKEITTYIPITKEILEKKTEKQLIDDLEQALDEAMKLV